MLGKWKLWCKGGKKAKETVLGETLMVFVSMCWRGNGPGNGQPKGRTLQIESEEQVFGKRSV